MKWAPPLALIALVLTSFATAQETEEPALPPGLGEAPSSEPGLPPGLLGPPPEVPEKETPTPESRLPLEFHGFWDIRAGTRLQNDSVQARDLLLGETRLQLETDYTWKNAVFEYTGDFLLDGSEKEAEFDLRRLQLSWSPFESVDVRVGRQILTWGTGDLVFINDLFPKDWQAFFVGRDEEYLKAPSNAIKISWFPKAFNVDVVYAPKFDPDRYITGERVSFWNARLGRRSGRDDRISTDEPDDSFTDDEFALRVYRTIGPAEVALYAYSGFWKSPAGGDPITGAATFPALNVFGGSLRSTVGKGIGTLELGYYDSRDDRSGTDPNVNNSEFRFLAGYERELLPEFTANVQYFLQRMSDYSGYTKALPTASRIRDRNRHLVTLRLTRLLMNQDLTLSLFTFYSPSDDDVYLRPKVQYKATDALLLEAGANLFAGKNDTSFFGQFEDNTNLYGAVRFSF